MRKTCGWVLVALVVAAVALSGCVNAKNNVGSGMLWVATQGDQKLTSFSVNLTSGKLSSVGSAVSTGVGPVAMAITPDHQTLFLANSGDNTITSYSIGSDGSLKGGATTQTTTACPLLPPPCPGSPPPPNCGQMPVALTVDPSGKFLFVAEQGTFDLCAQSGSAEGTLSSFAISGTGLTQVNAVETEVQTDVIGSGPSAVAVAPTGNFLYITNQFTNTVQSFSYDTSGTVTGLQTYSVGTNPASLAFSRCAAGTGTGCASADGDNLFVSNAGSGNISIFKACIEVVGACTAADGSLTPVSAAAPVTGIGPIAVVVNPTQNFVYTIDQRSNQVSQFTYSPVTAALSALSPAAVSTASNPSGGGITADGRIFFVANNGSSNISVYTVNQPPSSGTSSATGRLIPAAPATVSLSGQPSAVLAR